MAEAKPAGDEGAPPKKKKLLLFIIIGVLVLVLGGGVAAFLLLKKSNHAEDEEGDEPPARTAKKSKGEPEAPPVFVKLDPFTVKLQTEQQESYLQATPELRVVDPKTADKVKAYTPEIRHKVLLLMSGKKPSEISTPQGVQKLANEVRVSINLTIDGPKIKSKKKGKAKEVEEESTAEAGDHGDPDDSVQAVLFTSFIIQ
ncbi:MAG: flagellar basal body-associated FliL family protein [Sterolibacteriaceae bacterium MAG5]|nr:flagellar basal body-associated FliL family protein [Candidatus Nitricoxidireducens bremensis]